MSAIGYAIMGDDTAGASHTRHIIGTFMFLLAVAAAVSAVAVMASDDSSASISDDWSFDINTKTLTYSGSASMPDYDANHNPINDLGASDAMYVKYNVEVTRIGSYAFCGSSLINVVIPEDATSIGDSAFSMCRCLKTVTVYDKVTSVGNKAFYTCSALTSISLPSTVTFIGSRAFDGCISMQTVTLPAYDSAHKERELVISDRAFYGCVSIESIHIPVHTAGVPQYAFYGCCSIATLTFGETPVLDEKEEKVLYYSSKITSFGDYAFYGCSSITEIMIPDMLVTIGKDVFGETSKLTAINTRETSQVFRASDGVLFDMGLSTLYHYPSDKEGESYTVLSSVISIDNTAFNGAKKLTSILMAKSDLYYSEGGVLFDKDKTKLIRYPEGKTDSSYTIPDTVVYVMENAFHGASNLRNLTLTTSKMDFKTDSMTLGTFDNVIELHVNSPDGYRIPECAYDNFTILNYDAPKKDNTVLYIVIGVVAALIIIGLSVFLIIRRKNRI